MEINVYLDCLFGINFLLDTHILLLTSILNRDLLSIKRICFTALFLAIYGTLIVFVKLSILFSLIGKLLFTFIGIFFFSNNKNIKYIIRNYLIFWFVSLFLGGVITYLSLYSGFSKYLGVFMINGCLYINTEPVRIIFAVIISYCIIWKMKKYFVNKLMLEKQFLKFTITNKDFSMDFIGLIDTGCELTMPVTGEGVIILDKNFKEIIESSLKDNMFVDIQVNTAMGGGCLKCFYPDNIFVHSGKYRIKPKVPVALSEAVFSGENEYNAIINPRILINNYENGGVEVEKKYVNLHNKPFAKILRKTLSKK